MTESVPTQAPVLPLPPQEPAVIPAAPVIETPQVVAPPAAAPVTQPEVAPEVPAQFTVPPDMRPQPEQVVYEWKAPNRPFKKQDRKYYVTIGMIIFLISLILFFAGQFILIAVGIAAGFLLYVLSAIPPETVLNQITTYGIRTDGQLYAWEELGRFWFAIKHKQEVLHIEVSRFPHHITLLPGEKTREELTEVLSNVLLQEQPLPTTFDKAAAWFQDKIQLDPEA